MLCCWRIVWSRNTILVTTSCWKTGRPIRASALPRSISQEFSRQGTSTRNSALTMVPIHMWQAWKLFSISSTSSINRAHAASPSQRKGLRKRNTSRVWNSTSITATVLASGNKAMRTIRRRYARHERYWKGTRGKSGKCSMNRWLLKRQNWSLKRPNCWKGNTSWWTISAQKARWLVRR